MALNRFQRLIQLCLLFAAATVTAEIATVEDAVFARVGDSVILVSEYKQALINASRDAFYHGAPPENELLAFQQEVADTIINRELLVQQAARLGLRIDAARVEQELDKYRGRASRRGQEIDEGSEDWLSVKRQVEEDFLAADVETRIRESIALPSEQQLQSHYQEHPDKFTEPARFDLSTILLGVDPSAGATSWEAARQEARDLVDRLRAGADFAELARIHSADASADDGGALGYSHKGMFSVEAQEMIEKLALAEISEPLQVLEGIVIFRLNGLTPAKRMEFSQVRERVQKLWLRDESDRYWLDYLQGLRLNASIEIDEKYLTVSGTDSAAPTREEKK